MKKAQLATLVALAFPLAAAAQSTPAPGSGSLDVWFKSPRAGNTVSGTLSGTNCYVAGTGVSRVDFYVDNVKVSSDSTMSDGMQCQIDTTKLGNGTHSLKATAVSSTGTTRSDVISINVQNTAAPVPPVNTAPTVSMTAPAAGTVSGTISYAANATDSVGVTRVDFALDGSSILSRTTAPYSGSLDTTKLANGTHVITATAFDAAGLSASSQVSINVQNTVAQPTTPTAATTEAPRTGSTDVWFKNPTAGKTVSGILSGSNCYVAASGSIARVAFAIDGNAVNTDSTPADGMQCVLDTTKLSNGTHSLKATATDSSGATRSDLISINVQNSGTTTPTTPTSPTNAAPTVSITAPNAGATISGTAAACSATASDDKGVASVAFALNGTAIVTDTASPYNCTIDTTKFANGTYNLTAVAKDTDGATTTATRTVTVSNTVSQPAGGTGGAISQADILSTIRADIPFSQQSGATGQVINSYPEINTIPESGITYSTLSNGETVRLGKQTDPANGARKSLVFQLSPNDPSTSGSKRSEFELPQNIQMGQTYWIAYSVYVYDWGTLPSGDESLFGTQIHSSRHDLGLSPTFTTGTFDGRTFRFSVQYDLSSTPSTSTQKTVKIPDWSKPGIPIGFGRWVDFVFQWRQALDSSGFFRAWVDGTQMANYTGPIGFNTPGYLDYAKFGYYNWSSFSTSRKVLIRAPIVVKDPTGSKYSAADLRAWVNAQP